MTKDFKKCAMTRTKRTFLYNNVYLSIEAMVLVFCTYIHNISSLKGDALLFLIILSRV